jgi:hypothetical protein
MFFINPFILSPAGGDFESIATAIIGSGGGTFLEFTSIPSTYQHLQLRFIVRRSTGSNSNNFIRLNSDTGSNYVWHRLQGDGSSASASANTGNNFMEVSWSHQNASSVSNQFGAGVVDILDYASTTKYTTLRTFGGNDMNGAGAAQIHSGLWRSTSAVTTVRLFTGDAYAQHTQAALYGVKAP